MFNRVHQSGHNGYSERHWVNRLLLYFTSDMMLGQSSSWWLYRHNTIHHRHTNMPGKEPKIFYLPRVGPYVYFFLIPFTGVFWSVYHSYKYLKSFGETILYSCLLGLGILAQWALFYPILGVWWSFVMVYVVRSVWSPVFMQIAVLNHIALDNPKTQPSWLDHQSSTTRNLKKNWFLSSLGGIGFVDGHVEHHLFPSLSNSMLKEVKPIIKSHLEGEGYQYVEESY